MHDRPTPVELVEAVAEFLETELLPLLEDERLRFRTRVAANGLQMVRRELEAAAGEVGEEELQRLTESIRRGDPPANALDLLRAHVAEKLRVASPRFLDRYG